MARKCESCDFTEKYKYWNEISPTEHGFFTKISLDFENHLEIPAKFVNNFKGQVSIWCNLIGPGGDTWKVRVSKIEGGGEEVVFSEGWRSFVEDHCVKSGDFLTFHYVGPSTFKVIIYDESGCQREDAHFSKNGGALCMSCPSSLHVQEEEQGSLGPMVALPLGSLTESQENDGVLKLSCSHSSEEESSENNPRKRLVTAGRSTVDESTGGMSTMDETAPIRAKVLRVVYFISNRRKVQEVENMKTRDKAAAHQAPRGVPKVELIMRPSSVYSAFYATIPKDWAEEHMIREKHSVELHVPFVDKSWTVGCLWSKGKCCQLRKHWSTFVYENTLEEGDICVLELTRKGNKERNPVLDVHIYRVVDPPVSLTKASHIASREDCRASRKKARVKECKDLNRFI